ncbi:MAG TPA: response regulator transcription factor [Gammaproteobacteria bacterium]|nr:response regulator transcription factor [Gammaproteobacteria bacterium]
MAILIIEDDERILQFVRRGLEAEGYLIETSTTGMLGLQLAAQAEYDLLILDLMLPDISGQEICRQLRQRDISTPILMLTAMDALEDKIEGLHIGADDYLTKPFAFDELIARIQALLRRSHGYKEQSTVLQVSDLTLNRETREIHRAGRLIELTPKEHALLEYFMNAPGRVFSRSKILDQVWGYNTDPLTNVVEVHIRNLRKKMDEGFSSSLIKTVRGFGYKLEDIKPSPQSDQPL